MIPEKWIPTLTAGVPRRELNPAWAEYMETLAREQAEAIVGISNLCTCDHPAKMINGALVVSVEFHSESCLKSRLKTIVLKSKELLHG